VQASCQILQPTWFRNHVIVGESQDLAPCFAHSGVASIGQPLLRLKQVAKTARMPQTEIFYDRARLVA
jgi:hypothetical protein